MVLAVSVLPVLLFLLFLCFFPLMVLAVSVPAVEVFWAKTTDPASIDRPREAIISFFMVLLSPYMRAITGAPRTLFSSPKTCNPGVLQTLYIPLFAQQISQEGDTGKLTA